MAGMSDVLDLTSKGGGIGAWRDCGNPFLASSFTQGLGEGVFARSSRQSPGEKLIFYKSFTLDLS